MNQLMKKLWNDEGGFILSTEAMILWTICVLGLIVGLVSVRDAAVTELIEVANTILTFDQSYSYATLTRTDGGQFDADGDFTSGSAAQDVAGTMINGPAAPPTWYGVSATKIAASPLQQAGAISIVAP